MKQTKQALTFKYAISNFLSREPSFEDILSYRWIPQSDSFPLSYCNVLYKIWPFGRCIIFFYPVPQNAMEYLKIYKER